MTAREISEAIAKAYGWTYDEKRREWNPPNGWMFSDSKFAKAYLNDRESPCLYPPDYCGNLDAMHEAEKHLNYIQLHNYYCELRTLCCPPEPHTLTATECAAYVFTATAAQRAEAFLKTINKWEDDA